MKKVPFRQYEHMKMILEHFKGKESNLRQIPEAVAMMIDFFKKYPPKMLRVSTLEMTARLMEKPKVHNFWAQVFTQVLDDPEELRSFRRRVANQSPRHRATIAALLTRPSVNWKLETETGASNKVGRQVFYKDNLLRTIYAGLAA